MDYRSEKRLLGAFDTDLVLYRPQMRHLIKVKRASGAGLPPDLRLHR